MLRSIALLILCLLVGCGSEVSPETKAKGAEAWSHTQKAARAAGEMASSAWRGAFQESRKLDEKAPASAIKTARDNLSKAKAQAKRPEEKAAIEEELERLRAALNLQALRSNFDKKVAEVNEVKQNMEGTAAEARAKAAEAEKTLQDLQRRITEAENTYERARDSVTGFAERVQGVMP
jgi:chromosome segregation ATPase